MNSILLLMYCLMFPVIHCNGNNVNGDFKSGVFSKALEDWIVSQDEASNSRESRVMKFGDNSLTVLPNSMTPHKREVSETDLYLLGAIEKLLFKVESLEKRLTRAEQLLYYVVAGNNSLEEPCPMNYTKISKECYYISSRGYDWKSSSSLCRGVGSNLIEFETSEEYRSVKNFLQNTKGMKGYDFWTGGLNPGLLWIWASSAKPVHENQTETVDGHGRCLKIRNSLQSNYAFYGEECIKKLRYICKLGKEEYTNKIGKIDRGLKIKRKTLH